MSSMTATIGMRLKEVVVDPPTVRICTATIGKVAKKFSSWAQVLARLAKPRDDERGEIQSAGVTVTYQ